MSNHFMIKNMFNKQRISNFTVGHVRSELKKKYCTKDIVRLVIL